MWCSPSPNDKPSRGVARIFQRGVTVFQNEGTHQIVMSFSPPVVGCLLKKSSQKGGGVTGTLGPPPPGYAPGLGWKLYSKKKKRSGGSFVRTTTVDGEGNGCVECSGHERQIFNFLNLKNLDGGNLIFPRTELFPFKGGG